MRNRRYFNGLIFMGGGESTKRRMMILSILLEEALSDLSALQQGEQDKKINKSIEFAAKDIYCALTGKDVIKTRKMPYPPTLNGNDFIKKK